MTQPYAIAIVTYKRPVRLTCCLQSISEQIKLPQSVYVVDNDSQKSALFVINSFKKKLHIRYVVEKQKGVPFARNTALRICKERFIGFIDDDCTLPPNWGRIALGAIIKRKSTYILGNSQLYNPENLIAQAQIHRDRFWFLYEINPHTRRASPFNMDTKNVILDRQVIIKHNIFFDPHISLNHYDSSDTDLGFQLSSKKLYGYYEPRMTLYHKETTSLVGFLKRAYYRGRLAFVLTHKWKLHGEFVYLPEAGIIKWIKRVRYWPVEFKRFFTKSSLSSVRQWYAFLLIKLHDIFYLRGFVNQAKKMNINVSYKEVSK